MKIKKYKLFNYLFSLVGALIIGYQLLGNSYDFGQYKVIFTDSTIPIEPVWWLLRYFNFVILKNINILFCITGYLALTIKFQKIGSEFNFTLFCFLYFAYFITFFFLHEYTQFRVVLSISLFISYYDFFHKKSLFKFLLFVFFLCMIHYSSIILIPFYFYSKNKKLIFYIIFPLFSFLFAIVIRYTIFSFDLMKILNIFNNDSLKKMLISKAGHSDTTLTVFNQLYISVLFFLFISYFVVKNYSNRISEFHFFSIKAISFSIVIFYVMILFNFPVLAFRFSEFFLPLLLVMLFKNVYFIKQKDVYLIFSFVYIFLVSFKLLQKTGMI